MEPLPKGANFVRAKTLWEIGLHIAGNPATPYGGNRDMVITVGSGSGAAFRPWLRLATGSAILAEQVAKGDGIDLAFVNPSALLTQAYRGVGLFSAPLPVRIVAVYPSWDRFVFMVHPRTGIRSLADIKAKRYPLRVSVREDPTHSTLVLIDQAFALHGFALKDIESWGGRLVLCGGPSDIRRLEPLGRGEIDAVFDEGIKVWLDEALAAGLDADRACADRVRCDGAARMAKVVAAEGPLPAPGSRCRHDRFQRLADLRERVAAGAGGLRRLRRARRARSGDSLGEGNRWHRFAHGARERQHADGRPAPSRARSVGIASTGKRIEAGRQVCLMPPLSGHSGSICSFWALSVLTDAVEKVGCMLRPRNHQIRVNGV